MRTLLLLAVVPTLVSLSACGGGVSLALDLHSFITSFSGIVRGVGTTCHEKTGQRVTTIGPITADSVRGTVNGGSVYFDLPVEGLGFGVAQVSPPAWTNRGVVVGDSVVGDLSILFDWPWNGTRHAVRGKWTAVRR